MRRCELGWRALQRDRGYVGRGTAPVLPGQGGVEDAAIASARAFDRRLVIGATINRTLKAFALAIVGAEYVLRWLPRGTHSYDKLVTPAEFAGAFRSAGLEISAETGIVYVPLADRWRLSRDLDVNYMMVAARAA